VIQLRPIGIGCGVTLVLATLSRILFGIYSEYAFLLSGFIGGVVTAVAIRSEGDTTWQNNAHHGFLASGLGGIILFGLLLVTTFIGRSIMTSTAVEGDLVLFLTMSPLMIPTFATEGALGGLTESGVHALVTSLR